jgi:hypothetical protein
VGAALWAGWAGCWAAHGEAGPASWAARGGKRDWEGWATRQVSTQEAGMKKKFVFLFSDFVFKRVLFEFK